MTALVPRGAVAALAAGCAALTVCSCAATAGRQPPPPASPAPGGPSAAPARPSGPQAAPRTANPAALLSFATPVQAALSWFAAVNAKDKAAASAHFVPADAGMMNWGNGDPSTWSTFTALRCRVLSQQASAADVYCSFNESQAPAEGSPGTFWTISLQRQPDNRWLIANYGQG